MNDFYSKILFSLLQNKLYFVLILVIKINVQLTEIFDFKENVKFDLSA